MSEVEAPKQPLPRWFLILVAIAGGLVLLAMLLLSFKLQPAPPQPESVTIEAPEPIPPAEATAPNPALAAPKSAASKSARGDKPPAPSAAPPLIAPDSITNPRWMRKPTGEQLMDLYPPEALARGESGAVTLDCVVIVDGALNCEIASETPPGMGFGRAALGAARRLKLAPDAEDAQPTYGRHIRIPMRFDPPRDH